MNYNEVMKELDEITAAIDVLRKRRKELVRKKLEWERGPSEEVHELVHFVEQHPGCDKQAIVGYFVDRMSIEEINNLVTQARRNWNFIENKGTRQRPRWHVTHPEFDQWVG